MFATPEIQSQIRSLVAVHGVGRTARMLGTNPETLSRLAAGFEVKPISIAAVRLALASLAAPVALATVGHFGEAPQGC